MSNRLRKRDTEEWKALDERKALAAALVNAGATYEEVADRFNLPRYTIKDWCRGRAKLTEDARQRARLGR